MKKVLLIALLCAALGCTEARAHVTSTSFLSIESAPQGPVSVRWDLSLHNLIWSVFIDADFDGMATASELAGASTTISNAVLGQVSITRGGEACALTVSDLARAKREDQDYLAVSLPAHCPQPGLLSVGGALFMTGENRSGVRLQQAG